MSLSVRDRVVLARQAYVRAVAIARARSTPSSWARLLTAARNRAAALRAQETFRAEPRTPRPARGSPGGEARDVRPPPPPTVASHPRLAGWTGLAAECERARALMAWSRALVEESRALQHALASLTAQRPRPLAAPSVP